MKIRPAVLAVDGNAVERNLIKARLNLLEYDSTVVADMEAAVECLSEGKVFGLILTDIRLSGGSGLDLLRHIRALDGDRARTPVVAVTAMAMRGDRERLMEAGMDGYLAKPYRQTAFETMVMRFMRCGAAHPGAPVQSVVSRMPRAMLGA